MALVDIDPRVSGLRSEIVSHYIGGTRLMKFTTYSICQAQYGNVRRALEVYRDHRRG